MSGSCPTLDVEWVIEPLPDPVLVDLLGDRVDGCSCRWVSAEGISTWLRVGFLRWRWVVADDPPPPWFGTLP